MRFDPVEPGSRSIWIKVDSGSGGFFTKLDRVGLRATLPLALDRHWLTKPPSAFYRVFFFTVFLRGFPQL